MTGAIAALRDRFLAAQLAGDRRRAVAVLCDEGLAAGHSVRALQLGVVEEAQREIGRLWQENRVNIAQEHMATAIAQVALARLAEYAEPEPARGHRVVVACVEGELHDFPARIAADVLEHAGFDVRFLGASVPTESLLSLVAMEGPDLVALSVTMSFHVAALAEAVRRLRAAFPTLRIVVGGHACGWLERAAERVGADGAGDSAEELLAEAERLLGPAR